MKTGNKLGLRLTSTECQSTKCPSWRCNPKPIVGYIEGNLGIAKIVYVNDTIVKNKLNIRIEK